MTFISGVNKSAPFAWLESGAAGRDWTLTSLWGKGETTVSGSLAAKMIKEGTVQVVSINEGTAFVTWTDDGGKTFHPSWGETYGFTEADFISVSDTLIELVTGVEPRPGVHGTEPYYVSRWYAPFWTGYGGDLPVDPVTGDPSVPDPTTTPPTPPTPPAKKDYTLKLTIPTWVPIPFDVIAAAAIPFGWELTLLGDFRDAGGTYDISLHEFGSAAVTIVVGVIIAAILLFSGAGAAAATLGLIAWVLIVAATSAVEYFTSETDVAKKKTDLAAAVAAMVAAGTITPEQAAELLAGAGVTGGSGGIDLGSYAPLAIAALAIFAFSNKR